MRRGNDIELGEYESIDSVSEGISVQAAEQSSEAHATEKLAEPSGHHGPIIRAEPSGANASQNTFVTYSALRQTRGIVKRRIWGCLFTVILVLLILAILRIWEHKGVTSNSQKTLFNFLSTVLSIALGLNFSEAFKGLASILRWRVLAQDVHSVRETDLILGASNFLDVLVLAKESRRKPRIASICASWILLFLCAQAAISLVSLTYDFNAGSDYTKAFVTVGKVSATDLSGYYPKCNPPPCPGPPGESTKQGLAHSYGGLAIGSTCGNYSNIAEVLDSKHIYDYYCRRDPGQQEFTYRFLEYNPNDIQRTYPWMTDRIITARSGTCFVYNETLPSTLGPNRREYTYTNGSFEGSIEIPYAVEMVQATTYIYRGFHEPAKAKAQQCGPRCLWIWAHRNIGGGEPSSFYQCPISITEVSNAYDNQKKIFNDTALLAAASIAVNGRVTDTGNWTQWQFSPFGSQWEIHYKDPDQVGANMAEFAIASIANMASQNPLNASFIGNLTHLGQEIDVHWQSAIPLLAVIVAAHVALFSAAVYVSRRVLIKDNSLLAMARLLRPLVDTLGDTGTAMGGKDLSEEISKSPQYQNGVLYGPRTRTAAEVYALDLAKDVRPLDAWHEGRHPDGEYT